MPAHVQISLLRRMSLLPGGAVMTLSVIILTTSELLHEYDIEIKLLIAPQTHNLCLEKFTL